MAETQEPRRQTTSANDAGIWKTMRKGLQQRRRRMTIEARRDVG